VTDSASAGAVARPTARVLLIDGLERTLLFEMHTADGRVFWCPPGGGLEEGETHPEAAVRELREETGWTAPDVGPVIGERRQVVTWNDGVTYDCAEVWFLARVDALDVDSSSWTDDERIDMGAHRWWTVAELEVTSVELTPNDLAARVRSILADGPPAEPWRLGR
jgi:8-oxo-dGTP pyrophosphatase MutT (NUDIX family)